MKFEEVLVRRASCRKFASRPVGDEIILELLRAGCYAPSPLNQQPWEFLVVRSATAREHVLAVAAATRDAALQATGKTWLAHYDLSFLREAPVLIAVLADPTKIGLGSFLGDRTSHLKAASACVQNILLAAANRELGAVWFTLYDPEELKRSLGIPSDLDVVGLLPIGYPREELRQPRRQKIEEKIRYLD